MRHCSRRTFLIPFIFICLLFQPLTGTAQSQPDPLYTQALVQLCQVWGLAKYYHPEIAKGSISWDVALLRTVPELRAVQNEDDIRAALVAMLDLAGEVPDPVDPPEQFTDAQKMLYDVSWIDQPFYSGVLGERLRELRDKARIKLHCLVDREVGTGKPVFDADNKYYDEEDTYPPEEYRILAFCRYWNAIQYFYPYRDILDRPWLDVLNDRIMEWAQAEDAMSYHKAALRTSVDLSDAHAVVSSDLVWEFLGNGMTPFTATVIDGEVVIDRSLNPMIKRGDIIRELDDYPIQQLMDSLRPYAFDTNPNSLALSVLNRVCRGPLGPSTVLLENSSGTRTETFERSADNFSIWNIKRHVAAIDTILPNGKRYGYIDMERLEPNQIEAVMNYFREADAIVFDIRGYPAGSIFRLANFILPEYTPVAKFSSPRDDFAGMLNWQEVSFGGNHSWSYQGKLIVLINEMAISHAEYTCMFFKAAPNCTFIGSPTRGSDGNVTNIALPGGMIAMFTGLGVYYPDGTPTQRVGIQPDILVGPTIAGLREGRDEVFEAAFNTGLLSAPLHGQYDPQPGLTLYPAPAITEVSCRIDDCPPGNFLITVYDALGRLIISKDVEVHGPTTVRFPTAGLAAGLHFIRATPIGKSDTAPFFSRFIRY